MGDTSVVIRHGLPEDLRGRAAEILDEAFDEKLALAIPDRRRRVAFLARTIRASSCLVALDGDEMLGLVCLNAPHGAFGGEILETGSLGVAAWRELLGVIGAVRAAVLLRLFYTHKAKPDEIYLEFVAVASAARGRGIGSTLLEEARRATRDEGFEYVRLEVVDTNPRARALYERAGYRVVGEEQLGFMRRFTGFSSAYMMECPADPARGPRD